MCVCLFRGLQGVSVLIVRFVPAGGRLHYNHTLHFSKALSVLRFAVDPISQFSLTTQHLQRKPLVLFPSSRWNEAAARWVATFLRPFSEFVSERGIQRSFEMHAPRRGSRFRGFPLLCEAPHLESDADTDSRDVREP